MNIFLIRHGQTGWNRESIFRGKADIPLDETGKQQARAVAERLSSTAIQAVYASPLQRAVETARSIAEIHNLTIKTENGLIDFDFGKWQGLTVPEVQKGFPDIYQQWMQTPHLVQIPGGENLDAVRTRARAALRRIAEKSKGDVAIISHRVINKILICAILSLDNSCFWQIKQDVAAINIIEYKDGKFIVSLLNDTCHLNAIEQDKENKDF